MIYLLLSILANASLVLLFRLYSKWNIPLFPVIVFNYITAGSIGFLLSENQDAITETLHSDWLPYATTLGILFIGIFYLIGMSSVKIGVAATSVANKMSLAIPVLAAVWIHHDHLGLLKMLGVLLAMSAVYLAVAKDKKVSEDFNFKRFILPALIFFGSGIIDAVINLSQKKFSLGVDSGLFVSAGFATSATLGSGILIAGIFTKKINLNFKMLAAGIFLGSVNYCSILFLMMALKSSGMESVSVFPINNMGVVAVSAIAAFIFFGEQLSLKNKLGIGIAMLAIALIALS